MQTMNDKIISTTSVDAHTANRQWAKRPADERFETLDALGAAVRSRRNRSFEISTDEMEVVVRDGDVEVLAPRTLPLQPTNWGFGQLAKLAGAPGGYLSDLPPNLVRECLNFGLARRDQRVVKFLGIDPIPGSVQEDMGVTTMQAVTTPDYGRIWDTKIVDAAEEIIDRSNGAFYNPKDWSGKGSGLYASDRDIFVFLIDGGSIVEPGPRAKLSRGIFLWNSEVGSKTLGVATFTFNWVCGNHIIHGFGNVEERRLRHSKHAPERFIDNVMPHIRGYVETSSSVMEDTVVRAMQHKLPAPGDGDRDLITWFKQRDFTGAEARAAILIARHEEGKCETLWDAVQGLTAKARQMEHADARVDLERRAGKLLEVLA